MNWKIWPYICLSGLMFLVFPSCEKDPVTPEQEPFIYLGKKLVEADEKGGEYRIAYTVYYPKPGETLQADTRFSWIESLEVSDSDIRFTLSENTERASRTGTISVAYAGAESTEIQVKQEAAKGTTANCYVVSESGSYRIAAVKGNSPEPVGEIAGAEVLWESFGTEEVPGVGTLVSEVSVSDGFVEFTVPEPYREGNAVIAVKDASGKILWSWHIWLTDKPEDQVYHNEAGIMMDRNLGATSANPGDVGALGLLYQWGRKDPFLNSSSISESIPAASTIVWPPYEHSDSSTGTIEYATEHPTTFIVYMDGSNYDWQYPVGGIMNDTRWQSDKSIYDPCPVGYRVPEGGITGFWCTALGGYFDAPDVDAVNRGINFGSLSSNAKKLTDSPVCWYPFSGELDNQAKLGKVGKTGDLWSCSVDGSNADSFYYITGGANPITGYVRAYGFSVRCIRE